MHIAVDIRTNHRAGIYRYAKEVLPPLLREAHAVGIQISVIHDASQDELIQAVAATAARTGAVIFCGPEERYVRNDAALRRWIAGQDFSVYFTVNYMFDPLIEVPVAFVLHDVIPLMPGFELSNCAAEEAYGSGAVQAVQASHPNLLRDAPSGGDGSASFAALIRCHIPELVERAGLVITVSQASRTLIESFVPAARGKLCVIRNSVDGSVFSPRPASRTESPSVVLFVGLDKPHKRLIDLIDGFVEACRQGACGVLRLVSPRPLTRETSAHIEAARRRVRIDVEIGIDDQALATHYHRATAVCCPSAIEGFGLVALEAAACGLPVIASDIAAHRETLGDQAAYFAPGDVMTLARHIHLTLSGRPPPTSRPDTGYGWTGVAAAILTGLRTLHSPGV